MEPERSGEWYTMLGRREGSRLLGGFHRREGDSTLRLATMGSECGDRFMSFLFDMVPYDTTVARARRAALAARERRADARIDSTRPYGELEVTCPATHLGPPGSDMVVLESMRNALALPAEVLASFIITRDGRVERRSIHLFGEWSRSDRDRIVAAVGALRFSPARFAGYRVPQRSHVLIGRKDPTGPGAHDMVRSACINDDSIAVSVRALVPAQGVPRRDLDGIGLTLLRIAHNSTTLRPPDGVVRFVAMPDGTIELARWITLPSDTSAAFRRVSARHEHPSGLMERLAGEPYGIEAEFSGRCPR